MKATRYIVSIVLFVLCGISLWVLWIQSSLHVQQMDQSQLLWLGGAILISVILNRYAHRLGHLLGGLLSGYRLVSIDSLFFRYHKTSAKRITRIPQEVGIIPTCLMMPKSTKKRMPYFLYVSGGIAIHLLIAIGFYFVGIRFSNPMKSAFLVASAISILFFLVAAFPIQYADGRLLLELLFSKESRELYFQHLRIRTLLEEQETYAAIEIPEQEVQTSSYLKEYIQVIQLRTYLSQRQFENAFAVFQSLPKEGLHQVEVSGEEVFFDALYGRLDDSKRKWKQRSARLVRRNHPLWVKRIRASVNLFANLDMENARKIVSVSTPVSNGTWSRAEIAKETTLLQWLEQYVSKERREETW